MLGMNKHLLPGYRFPWRAGNRFELLVDGCQFYPQMIAAIAGARRYILLEIYLFESGMVADRFIAALTAAAAHGVAVKLLVDDFGGSGLSRRDRARLTASGVALMFYNPFHPGKWFRNFARDHRKLLQVDGTVAFVGGAGITDEFDPPHAGTPGWRETMIRIEGPALADWESLFSDVWNRHAAQPLDLPQAVASSVVPAAGTQAMVGRVTISQGLARQEIQRSLIRQVRTARERVWIATAYFIPVRRVRRALRLAARRGVDVRLLLPGPHTDHPAVRLAGRRFYASLLRSGVRIFEYQPRVLHTKLNLCDDWASIGSSNLDRWNLRWNLEANQEVKDAAFASALQALFEDDFGACIEHRYHDWQRRPLHLRLREHLWGKVDCWLNRLGRGRQG
jgi:phosphatidylserine/phosphatidylglycerophosphate/cardiolipin synthase-like enzyme